MSAFTLKPPKLRTLAVTRPLAYFPPSALTPPLRSRRTSTSLSAAPGGTLSTATLTSQFLFRGVSSSSSTCTGASMPRPAGRLA